LLPLGDHIAPPSVDVRRNPPKKLVPTFSVITDVTRRMPSDEEATPLKEQESQISLGIQLNPPLVDV
jgi:hypothetical protein